jgi:hypothetical protein
LSQPGATPLLTARLKTMDIAVSPKTGRRRGVTKENTPRGSLTEEQRSRRAVLGETLQAEALLARFLVAPRCQIPADMRARRSANQTKISRSSNVHSLLTGC